MRKRMLCLPLSLLLCVVWALPLAGCGPQPEDITRVALTINEVYGAADEITQTSVVALPGQVTLEVTRIFDENGELYAEGSAPAERAEAAELTPEVWRRFARAVSQSGFNRLPPYFDTGASDGYMADISVTIGGRIYTSGGLAADREGPEGFRRVWNAFEELCAEADIDF